MSKSGIVYCLMSPSLSKIYIGSTIQTLNKRLSSHKFPGKKVNCKSKIIIDAGDYSIFAIEEIKYDDIKDLRLKEGEWINAMKNSGMLVNKVVAGRTKAGWYIDNKELTLARSKKRVEDNKDTYNEYQRKYQRERAREQAKNRTDEERELYNKKRREYRQQKKMVTI